MNNRRRQFYSKVERVVVAVEQTLVTFKRKKGRKPLYLTAQSPGRTVYHERIDW